MNPFFRAVTVFVAVLFSSCAVEHGPPTPGRQPPGAPGWPGHQPKGAFDSVLGSPTGARLRYQDNHGRYTFTLFPGGRFRFISVSQNETMADSKEGRWSWRRTGINRGELDLGGDDWTLRFVSPGRAEATTSGDVRKYSFSFEPL